MSYSAIVARVTTSPHPNADRIQLGHVLGQQVIVAFAFVLNTMGNTLQR